MAPASPAVVTSPIPEQHVSDVADQCERQQALDVGLRDRTQDTDDHGEERGHQDDVGAWAAGEQQCLRADDRVDADLGEKTGEDRGNRRDGGRIAVRQPC